MNLRAARVPDEKAPSGPALGRPQPDSARLVESVRLLGAEQRRNADDLRIAIGRAKDAGISWTEIGNALGAVRETVFRQYKAGSPIVVVKAWQTGWSNSRRSAGY